MVGVREHGVFAVHKVTGRLVRTRGRGGKKGLRMEVSEDRIELRSKVFYGSSKQKKTDTQLLAIADLLQNWRGGMEQLASSAYHPVLA